MTLGYAAPRALCPHCAEEGVLAEDQRKRGAHDNGQPLAATYRFRCSGGHVWLTYAEDAELMGAFLDRQPS